MQVKCLIEFLSAAVDTKFISDGTFKDSGGIMLVGPPGSLKTTIIETACTPFESVLPLSDLNVHQWLKIKDDFVSKRYTCLALSEYEKVYQRHRATADNLEGIIKQLICEGYTVGPNGDPRMPALKARAVLIGGITNNCFDRNYDKWKKNGFMRRILWCLFSVKNPDAIVEAIREWKRIEFGQVMYLPANGSIQVKVNQKRSLRLEKMLSTQEGLRGSGYVLAKKITAVLEWRYQKSPEYVEEILDDVCDSFGKNGTELIL